MEQRISDNVLDHIIARAADYSPSTSKMALDLRDARAEIKRLQELSQSQAEALDLMEQGRI